MGKGSSASTNGQGVFKLLTLISLLAPLLFFVAVFGTRLGLWSLSLGFEVLTLQIARALAWVGAGAALLALGLGLRRLKSVWPFVAVSVVVSGLTLGLFWVQGQA